MAVAEYVVVGEAIIFYYHFGETCRLSCVHEEAGVVGLVIIICDGEDTGSARSRPSKFGSAWKCPVENSWMCEEVERTFQIPGIALGPINNCTHVHFIVVEKIQLSVIKSILLAN